MNYIFILADDLGFMDVALNGSTYYETPNIQRLAKEGVTFTNAYAHPLCSPTRSALMTGQYPHRTMINAPACHLPDNRYGFNVNGTANPWQEYCKKNSLTALPTGLYTIGEAFHDNGYTTALIGKHHLGRPEECQMKNRGFDIDFGMPVPGPGSYYDPYFKEFPKNNWDSGERFTAGEHLTDRLAREADNFISTCTKNRKPFMLQLWDFSVHAPFEAKKEYVEYFKSKNVPESPQNGRFQMACMLKVMDDAVGHVLDSLDKNGIADTTAVFFMGDNGGNMYDSIFGDFPTNNYPLRQGKGTIYEGGIRVPCVAKIPSITKAGSIISENIHAIDFYPTFIELANLKIDTNKFDNANHESLEDRTQVLDGVSLMPLLNGTTKKLDRVGVFTNFIANVAAPGNIASVSVNSGDWKLIKNYETLQGRKERYELYNLKENITETINLVDKYPEKVKELLGFIEEHQKSIPQCIPKPNENYDENADIPTAFKAWDKWVKEFTKQTASDPNISKYPKVIYENEDSKFYDKIKDSIIMKIGSLALLEYGYDSKTDTPPMEVDGEIIIPIKYNISDCKIQKVDELVIVSSKIIDLLDEDIDRIKRYLSSFEKYAGIQWRPTLTTKIIKLAEEGKY